MEKKRKIRMGMVGGGPSSFIGIIHYNAAVLDGQIELVCGAFSSDPGKSAATGREYMLPPERAYGSYGEMISRERELPEGERMDFACIVTPNHVHYDPAKLALENGFHVMSDKPMTFDSKEARNLVKLVQEKGLLFGLTHAYTGYPLVKQARQMVADGTFGNIRKIVVEYPQGWLSTPLEQTDNVQAGWRTDPERSGKCGSMGDIGTHALNLAEYVSGLRVNELCADLSIMVPGRLLDDDGNVLIRFDNGARGILYASQISAGEENNLKIRIYGEKGGLEWAQQEPNSLILRWLDKPMEIYRAGQNMGYLSEPAIRNSRMPAGHPEGLIEAFANLYRDFATCIRYTLDGQKPPEEFLDFPDVHDGLRGMLFIDSVVKSSESKQKWTEFINP